MSVRWVVGGMVGVVIGGLSFNIMDPQTFPLLVCLFGTLGMVLGIYSDSKYGLRIVNNYMLVLVLVYSYKVDL